MLRRGRPGERPRRYRLEAGPGVALVRSTAARGEDPYPWGDRLRGTRYAEVDPDLHLCRGWYARDCRHARGTVRSWSARSRRNLQIRAGKTAWPKLRWVLVTLTAPGTRNGGLDKVEHAPGCPYMAWDPDSRCTCWELWKGRLHAFRNRWERRWGPPIAAWAQEFQERGAVHYHLCIAFPAALPPPRWDPEGGRRHRGAYVGAGVDELRAWTSRAWWEVVGSGDADHLKLGTNVRVAHGHAGVVEYLRRELGKQRQKMLPEGVPASGRWWAFWGLDVAVAVIALQEAEFHQLARIIRGHVRASLRRKAEQLIAAGRAPPARRLWGMAHRYSGRFALPVSPWGQRDWALLLDLRAWLERIAGVEARPIRTPPSLEGKRRRTARRRAPCAPLGPLTRAERRWMLGTNP
jgi:hypothetical protein